MLYTLKDCGAIPSSRLKNHLTCHTGTSNWRGALIYISARGVAVRRLEIVRCNIRGSLEKCQAATAPTPWLSRFHDLWGLTGARIRSLKWKTGPYLPSPIFCFRPSCVNVYPRATAHNYCMSSRAHYDNFKSRESISGALIDAAKPNRRCGRRSTKAGMMTIATSTWATQSE